MHIGEKMYVGNRVYAYFPHSLVGEGWHTFSEIRLFSRPTMVWYQPWTWFPAWILEE